MGESHEERAAAIVADWAEAKTTRDDKLAFAKDITDPEEQAAAIEAAREEWNEAKAAIRARQDKLDAELEAEAGEG